MGASIAIGSAAPARTSPGFARAPLVIAGLFALLHVVFAFTLDVADPDAFLRVDRGDERSLSIDGLLATSSSQELIDYIANHGVVGDYAVHAALYSLGGRFAIVFVQIALAVLSGLAVYRIGKLLGLSARLCAAAMATYLCLPHVLVFPHQLSTEALHAPLFVISNWLLAETVRGARPGALVWSAVCLGLATLIRPITLLWPFVGAFVVFLARRPLGAALYVNAATLPVIAWMAFIAAQTGEFGLGQSGHSMERNLYERTVRIIATLPSDEQAAARNAHLRVGERSLGAGAYLSFAVDYPLPALKHSLRDAAAFFGKSGVERVTIDYLAIGADPAAVQDEDRGWRRRLELDGPTKTLAYLWRTLGPVLLASLAGVAFMAALTVLAVIGSLQFARRWRELRTPEVLIGFTLVAVVLYVFIFSQVLNAAQSRQRAPAEFALVLLAAVSLSAWRNRRRLEKEIKISTGIIGEHGVRE